MIETIWVNTWVRMGELWVCYEEIPEELIPGTQEWYDFLQENGEMIDYDRIQVIPTQYIEFVYEEAE